VLLVSIRRRVALGSTSDCTMHYCSLPRDFLGVLKYSDRPESNEANNGIVKYGLVPIKIKAF
jgi:hypothetical protein